jgi:cytochrome c6
MKNVIKSSVAVLVLVGLTGIASAADLSSNATYKAKCAMCHGANGEGKAAMKTKPLKEAASKSDADLTKTIENGIPNTTMHGYKGKLTDAQVKELVAAIKAAK